MKEYSVSYVVIGVYVGFVVVSTLLVGLLPALVNLPYCDPEEAPKANDPLQLDNNVPHVMAKRSLKEPEVVTAQSFEERQKRGLDLYKSEIKNNRLFRRVAGSRVPIEELKECPEIQAPLPSVEYPW